MSPNHSPAGREWHVNTDHIAVVSEFPIIYTPETELNWARGRSFQTFVANSFFYQQLGTSLAGPNSHHFPSLATRLLAFLLVPM